MEEMRKHGEVEKASLRAGMSRNTGAKYLRLKKLPSELGEPRRWRTRPNPFADVWDEVRVLFELLPELEVTTVFEILSRRHPERFEEGQLRTLQRHVRQWRAQEGPPKEVFFPQEHRPGEFMQTDFTCGNELGVTVEGDPCPHLLCHSVLTYSNWESATVCRSESLSALKRGVQTALFRLGRAPKIHQTDNSTAATHDLGNGKRGFNQEYKDFVNHFSMKPRTIQVGKANQNGDVESSHGVLKRRLKQRLLLRGSSDFESVMVYEEWVAEVVNKANSLRQRKLAEEIVVMVPISVKRLPEFTVVDVPVSSWSTIRVKKNTYSVPSRLRGEHVRVRVYDDRLEVYFSGKLQLSMERRLGKRRHRIDYRHVIWSLVKKPGAFARYRYRDDFFPSFTFRKAYDSLTEESTTERRADLEYLRVLHLAASTSESEVETALELLLEAGEPPRSVRVKALVAPSTHAPPEIGVPDVDLKAYDALLVEVAS